MSTTATFRTMTPSERMTLARHAHTVGATHYGYNGVAESYAMQDGRMRDTFVRDLPADFGTEHAHVAIVGWTVTVRMLAL